MNTSYKDFNLETLLNLICNSSKWMWPEESAAQTYFELLINLPNRIYQLSVSVIDCFIITLYKAVIIFAFFIQNCPNAR